MVQFISSNHFIIGLLILVFISTGFNKKQPITKIKFIVMALLLSIQVAITFVAQGGFAFLFLNVLLFIFVCFRYYKSFKAV